MWCRIWLAAALALCNSARGESAGEYEEYEELELRPALEDGHGVFQAYKVIGSAEWEVHNATLMELRTEDAIDLLVSHRLSRPASSVADKSRGVVHFVPQAVAQAVRRTLGTQSTEQWCRCTSSPMLFAADNWYMVTNSE
jgi:hypothetical protein